MKKIKVVIGAVFGDEGKGLLVDFFCNKCSSSEEVILNVRYNASSQAAHNVVTPEGKQHIFSHFGAGSFNSNVSTYLSSFFLVNPIRFVSEYDELLELGVKPKVLICKDSFVILPFDALVNIFVEEYRGADRHGSCGVGVFEAVIRAEDEKMILRVSDLLCDESVLFDKIKGIRDTYYTQRLQKLGVFSLTEKQLKLLNNDGLILSFIEDIQRMLTLVDLVDDSILNDYEYQVYEGAQGLLLDWDNREYMPNLTASYTGLKNVVSLLNKIEDIKTSFIEVCYVSRSYFTRHGAGRFETEVESKEVLGQGIYEKTNVTNPHQGAFRFGYFDKSLYKKNILKDLKYLQNLKAAVQVSLAITHLDQTDNKILLGLNKTEDLKRFKKSMKTIDFAKLYTSSGETRKFIEIQ